MKYSKSAVNQKTHAIPELRFEAQQLTAFSGLILFQKLFALLDLKSRLSACFRRLNSSASYPPHKVVLLLIVHLLMGFRELRHLRFYRQDPLVLRLLGFKQLPDVGTVSRCLSSMQEPSVVRLETLQRNLVLERLATLTLSCITLDFDGSVIGTHRAAEGTAVGFNRKKKGQRSYYPLHATVAQTGQVLATHHRSGNVHDSNGAKDFIIDCIDQVKAALPSVTIEVRVDSAFFSDEIVTALDKAKVLYTISVPFERFAELKEKIDKRVHWTRIDEHFDAFVHWWKPKSWKGRRRFVFVRQFVRRQNKEPLQLDLFVPHDYQWDYQVILTNHNIPVEPVVTSHHGRGSQEGIFGEMKSQNALAYIPTRTWLGNRVYLFAVSMAHNLSRELQMATTEPTVRDDAKRPTLWVFEKIDTIRRQLIQRAGRLITPQGKLTLSMTDDNAINERFANTLLALDHAY